MMRNWEAAKARYLQLDRPQQLGNFASTLRRIRANLKFRDDPEGQVAFAAIEECQHFTEWTVTILDLQTNELDITLAEELLELGREVSQWKHEWRHSWQDGAKCEVMATIAEQWSQKILKQSSLLPIEGR
jgi:hypothetical protein